MLDLLTVVDIAIIGLTMTVIGASSCPERHLHDILMLIFCLILLRN